METVTTQLISRRLLVIFVLVHSAEKLLTMVGKVTADDAINHQSASQILHYNTV